MDGKNVELTTALVAAYVGNNPVSREDFQGLITSTFATINGLGTPAEPPAPEFTPAHNPKKSVTPDYLVSLIDGRRYKSLKRHLSGHGLTPAQYRERYSLAADYPMVAPNYAKQRSELAKAMGLGQQRRAEAAAAAPAPAKKGSTKAAAPAKAPAKGNGKKAAAPAKAATESKGSALADATGGTPAGDGADMI